MSIPIKYGTDLEIIVPDDARSAFIYVRAATGDNHPKRQLRRVDANGIALLSKAQGDYYALTSGLAAAGLGERCQYVAADEGRATDTAASLMPDDARVPTDARLNHCLSLKLIENGNWKKRHADRGDVWMIREAMRNPQLLIGQPVSQVVDATNDLVRSVHAVTLAVGFEFNQSAWAYANGFPLGQLGLWHGQAYVTFLDSDGRIISIQKFTPDATRAEDGSP